MTYKFSAVIPLESERRVIFDQIVRRFANSYSMIGNTIYAEYKDGDQSIIDALIMTFEKYSEHEVTFNSS